MLIEMIKICDRALTRLFPVMGLIDCPIILRYARLSLFPVMGLIVSTNQNKSAALSLFPVMGLIVKEDDTLTIVFSPLWG